MKRKKEWRKKKTKKKDEKNQKNEKWKIVKKENEKKNKKWKKEEKEYKKGRKMINICIYFMHVSVYMCLNHFVCFIGLVIDIVKIDWWNTATYFFRWQFRQLR